jgi:tetratricopeptide (TPR) repeat protein
MSRHFGTDTTMMHLKTLRIPLGFFFIFIFLFSQHPAHAGESKSKSMDVLELLKNISSEFSNHLVADDDSTFLKYVRDIGFLDCYNAATTISAEYEKYYLADDTTTAAMFLPYRKRAARALQSEYSFAQEINDFEYVQSIPSDNRGLLFQQREELSQLKQNTDITATDKLEKTLDLFASLKELGDRQSMAFCKYDLFLLYNEIGSDEKAEYYLHSACSDFIELGMNRAACQALGVIGALHSSAGRFDSMFTYYDQSFELANRSRLPTYAPRILSFYSAYYLYSGRLSMASEMTTNAMELCREYKGGCAEIRYICDCMFIHIGLDCWNIVDRLMKRILLMERDCFDPDGEKISDQQIRIRRVEAMTKMAKGMPDEAEVVFRKLKQDIQNLNEPYRYRKEVAMVLYYWARGLLGNGLYERAIPIIREGQRYADESDQPVYSARSSLLMAQACYEQNKWDQCKAAIERFDAFAGDVEIRIRRNCMERDALLGMLQLKNGEAQNAVYTLENGVGRLKSYLAGMDACAQSYLWICEAGALRQFMHDMTANDPVLGYGAEIYWRELYRLLGRESTAAPTPDSKGQSRAGTVDVADHARHISILDDFKFRADAARARLAELDAIHILFLVRDDAIWRWTAADGDVRREAIGCSLQDLRTLVSTTWQMLSSDAGSTGDIPSPELSANLRELATLLLPSEVMTKAENQSKKLLLITTDDFLGQIPFETFDTGDAGLYTPLLISHDIAYLRHTDNGHIRTGAGPGVILVNAAESRELARQYLFHKKLEEAGEEAGAVAALDETAEVLEGDSATKSRLLSLWENAPYIYMATHTFRNPQIPYLMLIPLAPPKDSPAPDAAYLDVTDIRAADLSNCEIVVLSGCSSGAPYIEAGATGPGLGDVFLDAGAATVVQSFWDVKDDDAKELMKSFIRLWNDPESSMIHRLCEARREALQSPPGPRHPFRWAAYAIKIGILQ